MKFKRLQNVRPTISAHGMLSRRTIVIVATIFLTLSFVFSSPLLFSQSDNTYPSVASSGSQPALQPVKSTPSLSPSGFSQAQMQSSVGLNSVLNNKNIQSPYVTVASGNGIHANTAGLFTVTLSETNLPSGTDWYGGLLSQTDIITFETSYTIPIRNHTTSTSMTFEVPNGTYYLFAGKGNPNILFQTFTVSGSSVSISVSFPSLYKVSLSESGLPSGAKWIHIIEGFSTTVTVIGLNSSTTSTSIAYLPDGSYFIVNGRDVPTVQSSKQIVVNGGPVSFSVQIPTLYKTTFSQSSFSAGNLWIMQLSNTNFTVSYVNYSTSTSMIAYIPNGTYTVSGGPGNSVLGLQTVTVLGNSQTVALNFPTFYTVTFVGTGGISGSYWTLNIQNCNFSSGIGSFTLSGLYAGKSASVKIPDGTYSWSVSEYGATYQNEFKVTGQNIAEHFSLGTLYKVTFTSTNHSPGKYWEIELGGGAPYYNFVLNSSTSSEMYFYLPNGTYTCTVIVKDYANEEPAVTVSGAAKTVSITFPALYAVTFAETGLHPGMEWNLEVYDSNFSLFVFNTSSSSSMVLYTTNLTFSYSVTESVISGPLSETVSGSQGSYTVTGSSVTLHVSFPNLHSVTFSLQNAPASYSAQIAIANGTQYSYMYVNSTTGSPLIAFLPNGNFNYTTSEFKTVTNTTNTPTNSVLTITLKKKEFNVTGSPLSFTVRLLSLYKFTASESGLYAGTSWATVISSTNFTVYGMNYTSSVSQTYMLPNGSYYVTYFYVKETQVQSGTLSFSVSGGQASASFAFPEIYKVTFTQSYTGSCNEWVISISNTSYLTYADSYAHSVSFYLPNGTYSYSVSYNYSISKGIFTVAGASKTVAVHLNGFYQVSVSETGLPAGTAWYLNLTGASYYSGEISSSSVSFYLQNGTYNLKPEAAGILYVSHGKQITVSGVSISVSITFQVAQTYKVNFIETGLPSGTAWHVNVTGIATGSSSTTNTISVSLPNGSFLFTISNTTAYYATLHKGLVTVSGKDMNVSVSFLHFAYITGSVTPSGATVTVNGKQVTLNSGSFNVSVSAGTYQFVASLSGYKTYYSNFSLTAGQSKDIKITLTSTSSPAPTLFGINEYYLIGGIVAVIAVIGVALVLRHRK